MKVISILSYNGGAGKITSSIILGKQFAQEEKTCIIDVDFSGYGMEMMNIFSSAKAGETLSDLILNNDEVKFEKLLKPALQPKIPDLFFIPDAPQIMDYVVFNKKKDIAQRQLNREEFTRYALNSISELLKFLKEEKFKTAILDFNPGFTSLSKFFLEQFEHKIPITICTKYSNSFIGAVALLVSSKDYFDFLNSIFSIYNLNEGDYDKILESPLPAVIKDVQKKILH